MVTSPSPSSSSSLPSSPASNASGPDLLTVRVPRVCVEDVALLMDQVPGLQQRDVTLDLATGELLIDGVAEDDYLPLVQSVNTLLRIEFEDPTALPASFDTPARSI